ncbi:MAG TPA: hypothetical protein DIW17_10005 [Clostridiales bacterium]|nr:hypothetical protein [Clostridia bacterium]MDD4680926.1 hypothetical protein [Clostridia bacterium]HCS74196.1 hypothetical protein [Clostridiales bacterium]
METRNFRNTRKTDLFREESVSKVNTGINTLIFVLAWIGLVFNGFMAVLWFQTIFAQLGQGSFNIMPVILFLIFGGLTYFCFFVKNNQKLEYDYTFTNGTLDIAKIYNNSRRKKLLTTDVREFEILAPASDEGFQRMLQHPGIKKLNYFLNRGGGLYYAVFTNNGEKTILIFEPSDEMVRLCKLVNPRNTKTE